MSYRLTQKDYKAKTRKEWLGTRVRTVIPLQNSLAKIPAGTLCTIRNKSGGFAIETDPCPTCGIQFYITKVPPRNLRLVSIESDTKRIEAEG